MFILVWVRGQIENTTHWTEPFGMTSGRITTNRKSHLLGYRSFARTWPRWVTVLTQTCRWLSITAMVIEIIVLAIEAAAVGQIEATAVGEIEATVAPEIVTIVIIVIIVIFDFQSAVRGTMVALMLS